MQPGRLAGRPRSRGPGDVAESRHLLEYEIAPGNGGHRMLPRVVSGRVLHQASEHRRLGQGQRPGRGREVELSGDLNAVSLVVEIRRVQVGGEQLIAVHPPHDIGGDPELPEFPRNGLHSARRNLLRGLRGQDAGILHVLLRDV